MAGMVNFLAAYCYIYI